ncbi:MULTISPECIES: helix-turn-helix domain-containing protein [unclassified Caballeronia]|uniref:helix-turn-helix domain-containing protein n=1 Tax=unclassified Caballeronia TaxID=2646786 RepID=UPI0020281C58|nr:MULTISPECIES: helix-turn-helix domain-containing protein [unclassified Caballeronia]
MSNLNLNDVTLNAIRSIVAEEIRRYAEEQAAAKAARPKQSLRLTAEEAAQYMTIDEVAAVTGYGVPSLRSMASKKMTPTAFSILPVKVGTRSLYNRADVLASPKAQQFGGFIATPKELPPTQTMLVDGKGDAIGAIGASIQNAIDAAVKKPTAKKAAATKTVATKSAPAAKKAAPVAKKAPAKKAAPAAKKAPARKKAA